MLVYSKETNYVHLHYIVMELFDRTWAASQIFRDEYFNTPEDAYDAIIERGDRSRMYSLVAVVDVIGV